MVDDWLKDPMARGLGAAHKHDANWRVVPRWSYAIVAALILVVWGFLLIATFANGKILGGLIIAFLPPAIIAVILANSGRRKR